MFKSIDASLEKLAWREAALAGGILLALVGVVNPAEPPSLNPFAPVNRERDDAIPGYLEMSDGQVTPGAVYMPRA